MVASGVIVTTAAECAEACRQKKVWDMGADGVSPSVAPGLGFDYCYGIEFHLNNGCLFANDKLPTLEATRADTGAIC